MDIVMVRHGETYGNLRKEYSRKDVELTEKGRQQALETREHMAGFKDHRVYVSPYIRARETAELLGLRAEIVEDLREVNFGVIEGRTYKDFQEENPELMESWMEDPWGFKLEGGESLEEAYIRASRFLDSLVKEGEDVVLVSHDGFIRLALAYVFDRLDYFYRFKSDNLGISCISIEDSYAYIKYQNRIYWEEV